MQKVEEMSKAEQMKAHRNCLELQMLQPPLRIHPDPQVMLHNAMAPWNTSEPDIDGMLTPAFYGETILDTPLLLYGVKYIPIGTFTPLQDSVNLREEFRETLLYLLKVFGPDYFLTFIFEYKSR